MSYLKSNFERATLFENLREILISLQVAFKFKPVDPIESVNEAHDVNDTKTEEKKDGDKKQTALKKTDNKPVKFLVVDSSAFIRNAPLKVNNIYKTLVN